MSYRDQGEVSEAPLCIVHVSSESTLSGGAARSLYELIAEEQRLGHKPVVILRKPGDLRDALEQAGVQCIFMRYPCFISINKEQNRVSYVRKRVKRVLGQVIGAFESIRLSILLRKMHANLVHINSTAITFGASSARLCGIPVVWHVREYGDTPGGVELENRRYIYGRVSEADAVIYVSKILAASMESVIHAKRAHTIYDCLTPSNVSPKSNVLLSDSTQLCCIGYVCEGKGQRDLIEALAQLRKQGIRPIVKFAGPVEEAHYASLKALIEECKLEQQVVFLGRIRDPYSLLAESDILVNCSRSETFGRVTVEAMQAGLLVIGNSNTATYELLADGAGMLYDNTNPKTSLARVIEYAISHPEESRKIARRGFEYSKRFTGVENSAREILNVFRSVCRSG